MWLPGHTLMTLLDGVPQIKTWRSFAEVTEIICGNYTDEDIWSYIKTGELADKVGAYAIRKYLKNISESLDTITENVKVQFIIG